MVFIKKISKLILPALLPFFLLTSCDSPDSSNDATAMETDAKKDNRLAETATTERDGVKTGLNSQPNIDVVVNPRNANWYAYTYTGRELPTAKVEGEEIVNEPMTSDKMPNKKSMTTTAKAVKTTAKMPAEVDPRDPKNLKVTDKSNLPDMPDVRTDINVVYTFSETDRPPMFTAKCLNSEDPEECSNGAIANFIKDNINFPEQAIEKGHDGLEHVTFTIDENGDVSDRLKLLRKDVPCVNCGKAAMAVVSKMEKWQPAMRNGKPVAVEVTLPIRFETISR